MSQINNAVNFTILTPQFWYNDPARYGVTGEGTTYSIPMATLAYATINAMAGGIYTFPVGGIVNLTATVDIHVTETNNTKGVFEIYSVTKGTAIASTVFNANVLKSQGNAFDINTSTIYSIAINEQISLRITINGSVGKSVDLYRTYFYGSYINQFCPA